jgi:hypothetical protein
LELGFAFSLMVTIGGLWIYLLSSIIKITTENQSFPFLIISCIIHYIVFVYFILSIYIFYTSGLFSLNKLRKIDRKFSRIESKLFDLTFNTWPYALILSLTLFIYSKLNIKMSFSLLSAFYLLSIIALTSLYALDIFKNKIDISEIIKNQLKSLNVIWLFLGFFIYMFLMIIIFSTVKIDTEKEIYDFNDTMTYSLTCSGYFINPEIISIQHSSNREIPIESHTVLTLQYQCNKLISGMKFIKVNFKIPIININRSSIKYIKIVDYELDK